MHLILLLLWMGQPPSEPQGATPAPAATQEQTLIQEIAQSGRVVEAGNSASARVTVKKDVPPGAPPLLSFRYYEGKQHHRFGDVDLMLDDAGH